MRVLVVEDSRTLADVVAEGLRDEGIAVDIVSDDEQSLSCPGDLLQDRHQGLHRTYLPAVK